MSRTKDLRKLNDHMNNDICAALEHLDKLGEEFFRIGDQFAHIGEILTELDREFSEKTGIGNRKDLAFLFVATGLLCAKWIIMGQVAPLDFNFKYDLTPKVSRQCCKEGDKQAKDKLKENRRFGTLKNPKDKSDGSARTVEQILFNPVPYDTSKREDGLIHQKIGGPFHRAFTLGHDPILGWIFGPLDIMTRNITFKFPLIPTFKVREADHTIYRPSSLIEQLPEAFSSCCQDTLRIPAAVCKQGLHFLSDKSTKTGLPIPFLTLDTSLKLMKDGWNSVEAQKAISKILGVFAKNLAVVGTQYAISFLINEITKTVHLLMYNPEKDGDFRLYQVRTRKILLTANCISSTSNLLVSAGVAVATQNPWEGAKRLDIGGFIETIRRIVVDTKFIKEIKREYIVDNLSSRIYESDVNDFCWLYQ
jgi:hypothetical protein